VLQQEEAKKAASKPKGGLKKKSDYLFLRGSPVKGGYSENCRRPRALVEVLDRRGGRKGARSAVTSGNAAL